MALDIQNRLTRSIARRLAVLWTLLILAACSLPGSSVPDMGSLPYDKIAHFGFFFVYTLLWMHTSRRPFWQRALLIGSTGVAYGVLIEIYQGWLPFKRSGEPLDALADVAGLLVGLVTYYGIHFRDRRSA